MHSIDLEGKRFGFESEITAKIVKMNVRFLEVSISYNPRTEVERKR